MRCASAGLDVECYETECFRIRFNFAVRAYQLTISPAQAFLFGPTGGCRFTPTCSQYAMDAIRARGALAGGAAGGQTDLPVPSVGRLRTRSRPGSRKRN